MSAYTDYFFMAASHPTLWVCLFNQSSVDGYLLPLKYISKCIWRIPSVTMVENPPANERVAGSMPGSGRSPQGGNGNPLQYPCLGDLMGRGAWRALQFMGSQESWT